jgi:hypothetical protein
MSTIDDAQLDDALNKLDKWIIQKKGTIYENNMRNINNTANIGDPNSLAKYENELVDLYKTVNGALIMADRTRANNLLTEHGFPESLIPMLSNIAMRRYIEDRLRLWCITYPHTRNSESLEEQIEDGTREGLVGIS